MNTKEPSMTEQVARKLCELSGSDPDEKEPGDLPHCDGRGYGTERAGSYLEPWHWHWRDWTREAAAIIRVVKISIGRKGGKAGRGAAKRRPRAHYVAAAKKRWEKARG